MPSTNKRYTDSAKKIMTAHSKTVSQKFNFSNAFQCPRTNLKTQGQVHVQF
jgi:hypothetical protein